MFLAWSPPLEKGSLPATNRVFWEKKILGNIRRDERQRRLLRKMGWKVITCWACKKLSIRIVVAKRAGLNAIEPTCLSRAGCSVPSRAGGWFTRNRFMTIRYPHRTRKIGKGHLLSTHQVDNSILSSNKRQRTIRPYATETIHGTISGSVRLPATAPGLTGFGRRLYL